MVSCFDHCIDYDQEKKDNLECINNFNVTVGGFEFSKSLQGVWLRDNLIWTF